MFINPKTAISEGWITGIVDPEKQIQPNAIDFAVDQVFSVATANAFVISEAGKVMRGGAPYAPVLDRASGMDFELLNPASFPDIYTKFQLGASLVV